RSPSSHSPEDSHQGSARGRTRVRRLLLNATTSGARVVITACAPPREYPPRSTRNGSRRTPISLGERGGITVFIIAIALLTVLLVGILMFTDIVDEEGNLDRQR